MGDIRLGAAAYERVLRMDPDNLEAWMHLAQARKEVRRPPSFAQSHPDSLRNKDVVVLPPSRCLILFP